MPNALAALLKKKGTWRKLLSLFGFPVECLSGKSAACPFCKANVSFTFRAYDSGCWGTCTACNFKGNGWALVSAKTDVPQGSKELGKLVAAKLGLFDFGPDPDAPRFETRSTSRRKTINGS